MTDWKSKCLSAEAERDEAKLQLRSVYEEYAFCRKRLMILVAAKVAAEARLLVALDALKPFAAVWEYDDVPRHFPEAIYLLNGVRLHLIADDLRRASEARLSLHPPGGEGNQDHSSSQDPQRGHQERLDGDPARPTPHDGGAEG